MSKLSNTTSGLNQTESRDAAGKKVVSRVTDGFAVFNTVAEMVADTSLIIGDKVETLGYLSAGDGGGNQYKIVAAATGTDDGGSFINLATHQAQGLFSDKIYSVKQFGAAGDGASDDTSKIQNAIDFVETLSSGGDIKFPNGKYNYTTFTVDTGFVTISGDGLGTQLIKTSTTGNGVIFAGASSASKIFKVGASDLVFAASGTHTAGELLHVEFTAHSKFENLVVIGSPSSPYNGFGFYHNSQNFHSNFQVNNCQNDGIYFEDCLDTYINQSRSDNNSRHGLYLSTNSGVYISDVTSFGNGFNAWKIDAVAVADVASGNQYHFYENCIGDSAAATNWAVDDLKSSKFTAVWAATNTLTGDRHGITLGNSNKIEMVGCIVFNNDANGLWITGTSGDIQITGGRYSDNGTDGTATQKNGIQISCSGSVMINNAVMRNNGGYGFRYASAAECHITDCVIRGNVTGNYIFDVAPAGTFYQNGIQLDSADLSIASATTITLPQLGDYFHITGTTTISGVAQHRAGREWTFIFNDTCTIGDTGALVLAGNFNAVANDTITLISDGTSILEKSRSRNTTGGLFLNGISGINTLAGTDTAVIGKLNTISSTDGTITLPVPTVIGQELYLYSGNIGTPSNTDISLPTSNLLLYDGTEYNDGSPWTDFPSNTMVHLIAVSISVNPTWSAH